MRFWVFVFVSALVPIASANAAAILISSQPTANMACSGGVCEPTAKDAVLNAGDLETLLASGNLTVTTTGSGVQANDIDVKAPLTWSTASALSLGAHDSIAIDKPVSVAGAGRASLATGHAGALSFGPKGNVTFANLSSALSINGKTYTLVGSVQALAAAIAAKPSGRFALAADYNAVSDGTYSASPIQTDFTGTFQGLGNAIERLNIVVTQPARVGLFALIDTDGEVDNLRLVKVHIRGTARESVVGSIVASSSGTLIGDASSGTVAGAKRSAVGGLAGGAGGVIVNCTSSADVTITPNAGSNGGEAGGLVGELGPEAGTVVMNSSASGSVTTVTGAYLGGLVGVSYEVIKTSFATGPVSGGDGSYVGGLVGSSGGSIENAYATGAVGGGASAHIGGLLGESGAPVEYSYSTGQTTGGINSQVGGFIGTYGGGTQVSNDYWDTTTSGTGYGIGGDQNTPGITGLTTIQFQSGLPTGFDPSVWAENSDINGGFPYLISNPPKS